VGYENVALSRLKIFLNDLKKDVYAEPESEGHNQVSQRMIQHLQRSGYLHQGDKVLDVGCGQGYALETFAKIDAVAVGVTVGNEDLQVCKNKGLTVYEMDQSFLKFSDRIFDVVWCRHCLEHSIFPFFTLAGFNRVLKPEGRLYIEVPAPDTNCAHQTNKNHYSVFGKSMWIELINRSGFTVTEAHDIKLTTPAGPDVYYAFLATKKDVAFDPPTEPDFVFDKNHAKHHRQTSEIRSKFGLTRESVNKIDLFRFTNHVINATHRAYFFDTDFKEHYRLIAYLSTLFNNGIIFDIGTNLGYSAIALSFNPTNHVISYDIHECREIGEPESLKNIEFNIGDVIQDKRLSSADLIMLDTNHDGHFENLFYRYLKKIDYKKVLFLDDIHLNPPMERFWEQICESKNDVTELGHWSGSGIVDFS
jgi:SAM-dependent methyltransferase